MDEIQTLPCLTLTGMIQEPAQEVHNTIGAALSGSGVTFFRGRPTRTGVLMHALLDVTKPQAGRTLFNLGAGRGLFPYAASNILVGAAGTGKSLVAAFGALSAARRGENVLYIDYESDAFTLRDRLVAQGMQPDQGKRIAHWSPEGGLMPGETARPVLQELLSILRPSVIFIDSISNAMAASGLDDNDASSYIRWESAVVKPLANTGACVVLIDHTGHHSSTSSSARPRGSSAKIGQVSGQMLLFKAHRPFSRHQDGALSVSTVKDRTGIYAIGELVAHINVIVQETGERINFEFVSPPSGAATTKPLVDLGAFVLAQLSKEEATGFKLEQAAKQAGHSKTAVVEAAKALAAAGLVRTRQGSRNSTVYSLADADTPAA